MLIIPGLVLHAEDPPSIQDQAVREAQPASTAPVPPALRHALASSLGDAVGIGAKAIPTPPTGSWGIVSEGDGGGGIFRDSDSEAEAWLGTGGYGVMGFGLNGGGYFADSDATSWAYVGYGNRGIEAYGTEMGGYFKDSDGTGYAYVGIGENGIQAYGDTSGGVFADANSSGYVYAGWGDVGILAAGNLRGGYFYDADSSGYAYVAYGDRGIEAYGTAMGGYFKDIDHSGYAWVGNGDYGIRAFGNTMGGYFEDSDNFGYAYVGYGDRGIHAYGNAAGGYFKDSDSSGYAFVGKGDYGIHAFGDTAGGYFKNSASTGGYAYVGSGDRGIEAYGTEMGGYFKNSGNSGYAYVGYWDWGIQAYGNTAGGYFGDSDSSGFAYVGSGHYGITAQGNFTGGYFTDFNSSSYAYVGYDTYKIYGSGTVSFVQNHPYDPSSVIVYAAPEGDEVATYTRGTARLVDGEATVPLGETFKWVTNPDLGLTAFLTPVSEWCDLYLVEQATDSIVVRSRDGSDCRFNYMVYGLRIGFEESSVVQEKEQESYIPSMADHRQLYERRPDLKSYNSLERFKGMHHEINPKAKLDLSRAQALRDAIIEFDPAVHELPGPPRLEEMTREGAATGIEGHGEGVQGGERARLARADQDRRLAPGHSALSATIPVDDEGNVYATSFRPSSQDLASLVDVSEEVQPGDVLVIDRDNPGMMRKAFEAHDTGVIGVVALDAGVVLGTRPPAAGISRMHDSEIENPAAQDLEVGVAPSHRAAVGLAGVVTCNVDAAYGAVWPGDLLVTSPTPGHAMRADAPLPGTMLGKALEPLQEGVGTIKVLVMLR